MREGWRRAHRGLQPLPVSATPALPQFDSASVFALAPKTALLSPPIPDRLQGTILLDSRSPDTGTPSAAQPLDAPPTPSRPQSSQSNNTSPRSWRPSNASGPGRASSTVIGRGPFVAAAFAW